MSLVLSTSSVVHGISVHSLHGMFVECLQKEQAVNLNMDM